MGLILSALAMGLIIILVVELEGTPSNQGHDLDEEGYTRNCVVCGKPAVQWCGHVHHRGMYPAAGLCGQHKDIHDTDPNLATNIKLERQSAIKKCNWRDACYGMSIPRDWVKLQKERPK